MELTIAILGSSVLATLISGIFQVVNNRKSKVGKLEKRNESFTSLGNHRGR